MAEARIAVILASVREGRVGERLARWVTAQLGALLPTFEVQLVDLKEHLLGPYTLPASPKVLEGTYADEKKRAWAQLVASFDAFVVVTPEYNHGYPGQLKDALDHAYAGWNNKPIAFASYGGISGGIRAVQQLRQVVVELQMAPIREELNVAFAGRNLGPDGTPADEVQRKRMTSLAQQLAWWTRTLRDGRKNHPPN